MVSYEELRQIKEWLYTEEWDSLLINKRDPITYRLSIQRDKRYCLHYMKSGISKPHPHKYNVRVKILAGRYKHHLFYDDGVNLNKISHENLHQGSSYEIRYPNVYHQIEVEPLAASYSVMINDYDFSVPNRGCISTQNNQLGPIPEKEKLELIEEFKRIL
jgi:hypothetical protein